MTRTPFSSEITAALGRDRMTVRSRHRRNIWQTAYLAAYLSERLQYNGAGMAETTRTDGYAERSRALLAQAKNELAAGDDLQASEKLWATAAQMVKAVADRRGWRARQPPEPLRSR